MSKALQFRRIEEVPYLVSESVFDAYKKLDNKDIIVAEIDPKFMGGLDLRREYGVNKNEGANCIVDLESVNIDNIVIIRYNGVS